jgi:hypothetical protein
MERISRYVYDLQVFGDETVVYVINKKLRCEMILNDT